MHRGAMLTTYPIKQVTNRDSRSLASLGLAGQALTALGKLGHQDVCP